MEADSSSMSNGYFLEIGRTTYLCKSVRIQIFVSVGTTFQNPHLICTRIQTVTGTRLISAFC